MAIPNVDRQAILDALDYFDANLRNSKEWAEWDKSRAQVWVIEEGKKLYPPKKVISLATGIPVNEFSGGPESNSYLAEREIKVRRLREANLEDTFQSILERYHTARTTLPFAGNHEIRELFDEARRILEESEAVRSHPTIRVVSSYGKGNWATIPWISFLDSRETETTQDGTYVVYLFREDGKGLYIKLAQGVTIPQRELGAKALDVLGQRSADIRNLCSDLSDAGFDMSGTSDLGVENKLAKLYEASTIAAKYYPIEAIPNQSELLTDLNILLNHYDKLIQSKESDPTPIKDPRPIALLLTWRTVEEDAKEVLAGIQSNDAWAIWASFPIRDEAISRIDKPFHLYAYVGRQQIGAMLTISDFITSKGNAGLVSPWPDITRIDLRGKTRASDKASEIFKTWFKVTAIKILNPPLPIKNFDMAIGLSTETNLLNQSSFGYIFDDQEFEDENERSPIAASIVPPELPIDWLIERTGYGKEYLDEIVSALLNYSPQIMLAGPPGTGKTWLARLLAQYIARDQKNNIKFLQFHPTYSYESFVEGLRPVSKNGLISFEVMPGVVLELVEQMRQEGSINQIGNEFVVVIDEANRANLPKVLGELMFLFEYRNETIRLQYSGPFQLPENIRFIATMNTADRSIRSIDVALRRRFDVFELAPSPRILDQYYKERPSVPGLVTGFESLNSALEELLDRHHTIGHTFFMQDFMDSETLRRIWNRRVFPLIEEFFFDQPQITKEFTLEHFWPSVYG